jgi:C4-dicarboxylate-specific signal transduction histidine kinase
MRSASSACRPHGAERLRRHAPDGRVWLRLDRAQGQARTIEVGDTGHGMSAPEFVRERLFKPFQTTKKARHGHRCL